MTNETNTNRFKRWTAEDVYALRMCIERGNMLSRLARKLGRTEAACVAKAYEQGILVAKQRPVQEPVQEPVQLSLPLEEVADVPSDHTAQILDELILTRDAIHGLHADIQLYSRITVALIMGALLWAIAATL